MKYILALFVLSLVFLAACTSPDGTAAVITDTPTVQSSANQELEAITSSAPIDIQASTFTFEGFAPGKSHVGVFDFWSGELYYDANGNIMGGSGTIDAASVNTGIENLDNHLRSDDFFEVEVYPQIIIASTSLTDDMMTADVTFRGVTKSVTFPVTVTENSISADFLLDTTPFNMKYVAVNKEVKIVFTMVATTG